MNKCSNCYTEDSYNWISIESPKITITNKGQAYSLVADGVYKFCSVSCLNTYLMKIIRDDFD